MSIRAIAGGGVRYKKVDAAYQKLYSWISYAPLGIARYAGASFVYEGKVYFVGGLTSSGKPTTAVEFVDLMTLSRDYGASMPKPLAHFAHVFDGSKLYVMGGITTGNVFVKDIYSYDPEQNLWSTESAELPKGIAYCCACLINGKIYLVGGLDENGDIIADTYEIDLSNGTVTQKASMNVARENHACAELGGKVYVFGGDNGESIFNSIEMYDPDQDSWSVLDATLENALTGITATKVILNGKEYILIMGG